jgi:hypothetical protein
MVSIEWLIHNALNALHQITPETLTSECISGSLLQLKDINILSALEEFKKTLPSQPDNEAEIGGVNATIRTILKPLNAQVFKLNAELSRLKQLKTTLGIDELNPIIAEAQQIVRALFSFMAGFAEG